MKYIQLHIRKTISNEKTLYKFKLRYEHQPKGKSLIAIALFSWRERNGEQMDYKTGNKNLRGESEQKQSAKLQIFKQKVCKIFK